MVKITEVHTKEECNRIEECMTQCLARDGERCNGPDHPDCPLVDVTEYEDLRTKLDYAEADIDVGVTVKKITDNETEATIIELEADFKKEREEKENLEREKKDLEEKYLGYVAGARGRQAVLQSRIKALEEENKELKQVVKTFQEYHNACEANREMFEEERKEKETLEQEKKEIEKKYQETAKELYRLDLRTGEKIIDLEERVRGLFEIKIISDKKLLEQWGHKEPAFSISNYWVSSLIPVSKILRLKSVIDKGKPPKEPEDKKEPKKQGDTCPECGAYLDNEMDADWLVCLECGVSFDTHAPYEEPKRARRR